MISDTGQTWHIKYSSLEAENSLCLKSLASLFLGTYCFGIRRFVKIFLATDNSMCCCLGEDRGGVRGVSQSLRHKQPGRGPEP